MAAIIELVLALLAAPLIALLELSGSIIGFLVELAVYCVLSLFRGTSFASKYVAERRSRTDKLRQPESIDSESPPTNHSKVEPGKSRKVVLACSLILIFLAVAYGWSEWIQRKRVLETKQQVDAFALTYVEQLKQNPAVILQPATLPDKDAWGTPLELFVDRWPIGTLIVVRSLGRDRRAGTVDDLLGIASDSNAIFQTVLKVLKKRLAKILTGGDVEQLPDIPETGKNP